MTDLTRRLGSSLLGRYGVALGASLVAVLGRAVLEPGLGAPSRFVVSYPAIMVSAWFGGTGPGILTTLLCGLTGLWPWTPYDGRSLSVAEMGGLLAFLLGGLLMSGLTGELFRAKSVAVSSMVRLRREILERREAATRAEQLTADLQRRIGEQLERVATEQAARVEAQRQQREAELLTNVARTLGGSLELDALLAPIAAAARSACACDIARIALREPGSEAMVFRHGLGTRYEGYEDVRLEPGQGIAGQVTAARRALCINNVAGDPALGADLKLMREEGSVSALVVPILVGERVEGLIYVDHRSPRSFTDRDQAILTRLADQAALAIKNAQLFAAERAARTEAEGANRAKDEFLAMLGHEVRNPLGAIRSALPVLTQIAEQFGRVQDIVGRQTSHLARLLDDLLDVSKLAAGKFVLDRQTVDLKEVAERSLATLDHQGKTRQHAITVTSETALVDGDPIRLEQVVRNLVDNALKYTPRGGRITVAIAREGESAVVRVTDTGIGISAEALPRIFDPFVQGDQPFDRSAGGLGLGLSLVKRLVELHGGSVSALSAGPDRGSEFVVRLPLLLTTPPSPEPAEPPRPQGSARSILLIEDDVDSRVALRMLLESWGYRVAEAEDGESGVEIALVSPPDIALVDIGLPGLDGFAVAKTLRAAADGKGVYLVALTGYGQPEDYRRALEAGFDAYLVKPVDPNELIKVVTPEGA